MTRPSELRRLLATRSLLPFGGIRADVPLFLQLDKVPSRYLEPFKELRSCHIENDMTLLWMLARTNRQPINRSENE